MAENQGFKLHQSSPDYPAEELKGVDFPHYRLLSPLYRRDYKFKAGKCLFTFRSRQADSRRKL